MPRRTPIERLMRRVAIEPHGCWTYAGGLTKNGYACISQGGRQDGKVYAHRLSYMHFIGAIPVGMDLDHLCRNRACCNPLHLEPVTRQVNVQRGRLFYTPIAACRRAGHPYTEANTYRLPNGTRTCRACRVELYRARKAAA